MILLNRLIVQKLIPNWQQTDDDRIRAQYGILGGWVSIIINGILFILKVFLGWVTGSIGLIADGIHSFSDMGTSFITVISFYFFKKPSDQEHPFGHGRIESIGTVIIAVLLIVVGIEIFKTSINRILNPISFHASWMVILLIGITIFIKEWNARFTIELGKAVNSDILHADAWHHRTDAISSGFIVIAFITQKLGIVNLDGFAGIVISILVCWAGWKIVKGGIDDLLGKPPSLELVHEMKQVIRSFPGVLGVHDLIIHQYGYKKIMSLHIQVDEDLSLKEGHALSERISKAIDRKFYTHSTIHVDPINTQDPETNRYRIYLKEILKKQSDGLEFHDLRIGWTGGKKNLIFDLVIHPSVSDQEVEKIVREIRCGLLEDFPTLSNVSITVEPRFAL